MSRNDLILPGGKKKKKRLGRDSGGLCKGDFEGGLKNEWSFTVQERWLAILGAVGGRGHKSRSAADRKGGNRGIGAQKTVVGKEQGQLLLIKGHGNHIRRNIYHQCPALVGRKN